MTSPSISTPKMSKERRSPEGDIIVKGKKAKPDPSETREGLLLLAKLASECLRFKHMFQYMKKLVASVAPHSALLDSERRHFNSACLFHLQSQFDVHRYVTNAVTDSGGDDPGLVDAAVDYLEQISSEISDICAEVVETIDYCFLPEDCEIVASAATPESRVFYQRMKGDYLKYMAQVMTGSERKNIALAALACYTSAKKEEHKLPATNETRLELALHLAQLYGELGNRPSDAYKVAREAVDMATKEEEATGKAVAGVAAQFLRCLLSNMDDWNAKSQNQDKK